MKRPSWSVNLVLNPLEHCCQSHFRPFYHFQDSWNSFPFADVIRQVVLKEIQSIKYTARCIKTAWQERKNHNFSTHVISSGAKLPKNVSSHDIFTRDCHNMLYVFIIKSYHLTISRTNMIIICKNDNHLRPQYFSASVSVIFNIWQSFPLTDLVFSFILLSESVDSWLKCQAAKLKRV